MSDILTGTTVINLDISIWTGKARLQRDEVDDSALPPEELATLGSKKLFDPNKLRKFYGVKSSAFATCNKYGVKFLGGWQVDDAYLPELINKLSAYRSTWDTLLSNFLASYQTDCQDWLAQNSQWANILANSMPRQSEIAKRFNFGWQTYNVIPAPTNANGDQTQDELSAVPTRAIEKMAREIGAIVDTFAPGKTFRAAALRRVAGMCHALSFSSPEVVKLGEILEKLAVTGDADITHTMLTQLSNAQQLAAICTPAKTVDDILTDVVVGSQPPSEVNSEEPATETPEIKQSGVQMSLPDVDSLLQEAFDVLHAPIKCVDLEPPAPAEPVVAVDSTPHVVETVTTPTRDTGSGMIDSGGLW